MTLPLATQQTRQDELLSIFHEIISAEEPLDAGSVRASLDLAGQSPENILEILNLFFKEAKQYAEQNDFKKISTAQLKALVEVLVFSREFAKQSYDLDPYDLSYYAIDRFDCRSEAKFLELVELLTKHPKFLTDCSDVVYEDLWLSSFALNQSRKFIALGILEHKYDERYFQSLKKSHKAMSALTYILENKPDALDELVKDRNLRTISLQSPSAYLNFIKGLFLRQRENAMLKRDEIKKKITQRLNEDSWKQWTFYGLGMFALVFTSTIFTILGSLLMSMGTFAGIVLGLGFISATAFDFYMGASYLELTLDMRNEAYYYLAKTTSSRLGSSVPYLTPEEVKEFKHSIKETESAYQRVSKIDCALREMYFVKGRTLTSNPNPIIKQTSSAATLSSEEEQQKVRAKAT